MNVRARSLIQAVVAALISIPFLVLAVGYAIYKLAPPIESTHADVQNVEKFMLRNGCHEQSALDTVKNSLNELPQAKAGGGIYVVRMREIERVGAGESYVFCKLFADLSNGAGSRIDYQIWIRDWRLAVYMSFNRDAWR